MLAAARGNGLDTEEKNELESSDPQRGSTAFISGAVFLRGGPGCGSRPGRNNKEHDGSGAADCEHVRCAESRGPAAGHGL